MENHADPSPVATGLADLPPHLCPGCGYDLRGLPGGARCPECGLEINTAVDAAVTLPWAHRRLIGRARAYRRTVILSMFRSARLAANLAGPVSWADAVAFRRVTVALSAVPVAAVVTAALFAPPDGWLAPALRQPRLWWAELLALPAGWAGLWLTFLTAAGVASYWFHPRSIPVVQQNRAVALSLYACGPLALVPVLVVLVMGIGLAASGLLDAGTTETVGEGCGLAAVVVGFFILACWWWTTLDLLRRTTHCGVARLLSLAIGLPIAWALLAALFAIGLPAAVLWLSLIVKSLAV